MRIKICDLVCEEIDKKILTLCAISRTIPEMMAKCHKDPVIKLSKVYNQLRIFEARNWIKISKDMRGRVVYRLNELNIEL